MNLCLGDNKIKHQIKKENIFATSGSVYILCASVVNTFNIYSTKLSVWVLGGKMKASMISFLSTVGSFLLSWHIYGASKSVWSLLSDGLHGWMDLYFYFFSTVLQVYRACREMLCFIRNRGLVSVSVLGSLSFFLTKWNPNFFFDVFSIFNFLLFSSVFWTRSWNKTTGVPNHLIVKILQYLSCKMHCAICGEGY